MYNLLIVDDEPLTREYLKHNIPLFHDKWTVTAEAADGYEAWELLKHKRFDLIITDIKMPEMDGIELCKKVSEQFPQQKVVILSGHDEFSLAKEAIRYGVHSYLLKPLVKDELIATLEKITTDLMKETSEELIYRTMRNVSEDTKHQVVKQFLKAVVTDSSVEIKALYPLFYRLKVNLIEAEAMIMIVDLDQEKILERDVPISDISIFRFILHKVTTEIVEETGAETVFFDDDQNTVLLITGECEEELLHKCRLLHDSIYAEIKKNTGITIVSATGSAESDVLQLYASYQKARKIMKARLLHPDLSLFSYKESCGALPDIGELDKAMASIKSGMLDSNEMAISMAVKNYVNLIPQPATHASVMKFGVHLIRSIAGVHAETLSELIETALHMLKGHRYTTRDELLLEDASALFRDIVKQLTKSHPSHPDPQNDLDLVTQAKAYIYAHYSEPLSLALIAEKVGVSSSYLSNIFHKKMNEPYIKFLTKIRMEQAAKQLKALPLEKVYDVAERVGYLSVKHFSHMFKQYFGIPPGEFQEMHTSSKSEGANG
ncbi:response regulator [Paenibacillus roseipurpureus]|uniref:Response regulator n=1 Tax=Paenibacillus roseopurpureus TaxID=2918901 RepID=A0AA96LSW1_9BACL|nr:response regulator [Paenibacillus sp. MBLB1832]WNR45926.1 response regulator [Paenibacillus sp. MBLB1832]